MQMCNDAGKNLLDLIWVDADKSVDSFHNQVRSRLCAMEHKTKSLNQSTSFSFQFFSVLPLRESVKGACLNHDFC